MKLHVIINPQAANGRALPLVPKIAALLGPRHHAALTVSSSPGELRETITAAAQNGTDAVVLVGGDGTLHEALPALCSARVPCAVIPVGRGNDFARNAGLPLEWRKACLLSCPRYAEINIPQVNGIPFGSVACLGFDARVNQLARDGRGYFGGSAGYIVCVLKALGGFRPLEAEVTIDETGWSGKVTMVAVANGPYYGGGMRIAPTASFSDGRLTVCIIRETTRPELLRQFPKVFRGAHVGHPKVMLAQGKTVRVETRHGDEIFADGEFCSQAPAICTIGSQKLRILLPDSVASW
jgi:diacylglycerol kinase (ATP)